MFAAATQANLAHRDLRWKNVACDPTKQQYYLLDLELVAPLDSEPGFSLTSWGRDTLDNGRYTEQSDLHMLGKMLHERKHVLLSGHGQQFLELMTQPVAASPRLSAEALLNNAWIGCEGISCNAAGAQPSQN